MGRTSRILLRGAIAGVVALVLATAALRAGLSWLQSDTGRAWLVALVNRQLDAEAGTRAHIGRIEGDLWRHLEVVDLSARDDDGEWLHLSRIRADWSPAGLLLRHLRVADLALEGLVVSRAPAGPPESEESGWPEVPLVIAIERFTLREAVLEASLVGERVAFDADGSLDLGGGRGLRARLVAQRSGGASGELRLDADLRPRSDRYGIDLALDEAPGGVLARLLELEGLPAVSLQVTVGGPARDLAGNLRARLGELARVDGTLELDARGGPAIALAGRAEVAGLLPPSLREALSGEIAFDGRIAQTADGFALRDVRLERGPTRIELSGQLRELALQGEVALSLADLAPLGAWLDVPLRGAGELRAQLRSDDVRRGVDADLSATWRDPLPPDSPGLALVGRRVELSGRLAFEAERSVALRDFAVATAGMTLAGEGELDLESPGLAAELRLELPDAAVLDALVGAPLAGSLRASGRLAGDPGDPALVASLASPDLSVDGVPLGPAQATLDLVQLASDPGGRVALSLEPATLGPLSLETGVAREGAHDLRLAPIALRARQATLAGALRVDLERGTASGQLAASDVALAEWSEPVGRSLSGRARLSLELEGGAQQGLRVAGEVDSLVLALEPGALTAASGRFTLGVEDAWGSARPSLDASATTVALAGVALEGLEVALDPTDEGRLHGRLHAWGEARAPLRLEVEGDYLERDEGPLLALTALAAEVGDHRVRLQQPTSIAWQDATTTLSPTRLALDDGSLSAEGRLGASQLDASVELDAFPLALLDVVIPVSAPRGALSGRLTLAGTRTEPTGELHLQSSGSGVVAEAGGAVASVPARLDGDWRGGRCELRLVLREPGGRDVDGSLSLPLRLDPETLVLSLPPPEPVAGRLRWEGDPGPLWDLLSPYEDRLRGRGNIEVVLAGSVGAPRVSGRVELAEGRYENLQTGTAFSDLRLRLLGDGERLVLEELAASDGVRGRLSGRGVVLLLPARHYPIDVSVGLDDLLLVARDELILRASGKLALDGTLAGLALTGRLETGRSELSLNSTLPPSVVELDVDEVNAGVPLAAERDRSRRSAASLLSLDVGVVVPGRAFARGLGLDSEWSGELQVSGRADAPRLSGVLSPVRGHFTLMGKRFSLERGAIRFTGSDQVDPLLDLSAEHRASGVTAIVRVTGTASQPEVKLTSRPPMPEADVASQVLFGTGSANLTPSQSLQLATAVATYSGVGGPVGILDTTRRTLGIDVIGFSESEQNPDATRVSVGKYITDGVYVEVEAGGEETSHAATTVEVEVLPDVRVEGGTTEKGGTKVGVKWKWDY